LPVVHAETLSPTKLTFSSGSKDGTCGAMSSTQSGGGTTRISASIQNVGGAGDLNLTAGKAQASAWISYSFFLATTSQASGPVPFSVNLHAQGSASAKSEKFITDQGQFLNSGQVISSSLRAFGSLSGNGQAKTFEERASVRAHPGEEFFEALSGNFTTPTIMVEAGDLISISFGLDGSTGGQLFGAAASGNVSAINSLSFATEGDVFNLADGYSVVIDEARIVNNRYTPPPALISTVPLPAAVWGLAFGLAGLASLRRKA
jgi:hypothetical protein